MNSNNKKNAKNHVVTKTSDTVKSYPTFSKNIKGWINYDKDNLLPQLNNESAINKAVIDKNYTEL